MADTDRRVFESEKYPGLAGYCEESLGDAEESIEHSYRGPSCSYSAADDFEYVDLRNLELISIPGATIANVPEIYSLDVRNNHLTELPGELGGATTLRRLYCSDNDLSDLPAELKNCHLIHISCARNAFRELPGWLTETPTLRRVRAGENPLVWPPPDVVPTFKDEKPVDLILSRKAVETGTAKMLAWMKENPRTPVIKSAAKR
jgi:hypothetical protein